MESYQRFSEFATHSPAIASDQILLIPIIKRTKRHDSQESWNTVPDFREHRSVSGSVFLEEAISPRYGLHDSVASPGGGRDMSVGYLLKSAQEAGSQQETIRRIVSEANESTVFDFYIKHAGPWLDIVCPDRHFGQSIPKLALKEPVLYYACLAYASHVLFLLGRIDKSTEEQYHNKSIGLLIPLLSSQYAPQRNEALLATTVILRMSEQFSEIGDDAQHHLNGAFSLFATIRHEWSPRQTDVRGTAFWIYIRESIRVCFLNEQACQFDMSLCPEEASFTPVSDEAWTNRMTYLLARLCNACWGSTSIEERQSKLERLGILVDQWHSGLPETFQPWCFREVDYEAFPNVQYLSTSHVIGWQQYHTAKVMLAVYSSTRPGNGNVLGMNHYLETEVLAPARQACATCFSCDDIGSNINGTHLISWCGQYFTGKEEQRCLIKFLDHFMKTNKWPNVTCHERLKQIWSGNRRSWVEII
ncbi:MAG: hypothetical protein M1827_002984 [Pycnora praestabilis]|nr:MAG: hypothetical protein M1827_002984 [Pycnora praestabilis]